MTARVELVTQYTALDSRLTYTYTVSSTHITTKPYENAGHHFLKTKQN